jgi:hypothetical protein
MLDGEKMQIPAIAMAGWIHSSVGIMDMGEKE